MLAAFKFTRFNNFKHNLYNTLEEYETPAVFGTRINHNRIVSSLFNQQKPETEWEGSDPRFVAAVNLAVALLPQERGEILTLQPLF